MCFFYGLSKTQKENREVKAIRFFSFEEIVIHPVDRHEVAAIMGIADF